MPEDTLTAGGSQSYRLRSCENSLHHDQLDGVSILMMAQGFVFMKT